MKEKMMFIKKVTERTIFNSFVFSYFLTIMALIFTNTNINMLEFVKCHVLVTGGMTLFVLAAKLILEVVLLIKQLLERMKIFLNNKVQGINFVEKNNILKK